MGSIFLAPHNLGDDETLFGSFLIMRFRPLVVVVFQSVKQELVGITSTMRERETHMALSRIFPAAHSLEWAQGMIPDTASEEKATEMMREQFAVFASEREHCFAPAWEEDGHEQHNLVAEIALEAFGKERLTSYLTYRRGHARSVSEHEVPFEPDWPAYKLGALGCYVSQIALPATAPWFLDLLNVREYLSHPLTYTPSVPVAMILPMTEVERMERL